MGARTLHLGNRTHVVFVSYPCYTIVIPAILYYNFQKLLLSLYRTHVCIRTRVRVHAS